jgi:hypothetical protein
LSFRFEPGYGQHSIATAARLSHCGVEEGGLPDAGLAPDQQRCTMLRRSRHGSLELSNLGFTPDQPRDHAVKIREPGV